MSFPARIIARLDIKGPNVVKGVQMEGLRIIGDPNELARKYYADGADELLWTISRVVRPTRTPYVGAYAHRDRRGPLNCSIYDHGDFCLYCVATSEWDGLAPHVSTGPPGRGP